MTETETRGPSGCTPAAKKAVKALVSQFRLVFVCSFPLQQEPGLGPLKPTAANVTSRQL